MPWILLYCVVSYFCTALKLNTVLHVASQRQFAHLITSFVPFLLFCFNIQEHKTQGIKCKMTIHVLLSCPKKTLTASDNWGEDTTNSNISICVPLRGSDTQGKALQLKRSRVTLSWGLFKSLRVNNVLRLFSQGCK